MFYLSLAQVSQGLIFFLYNVVLMSAAQQNKSVISKYSLASLLSSPEHSIAIAIYYILGMLPMSLLQCVHKSVFHDCISPYIPNWLSIICFLGSI